ncbi:ABC transporter ATP-binding protein [Candidatus Aerophobetes bacterium]|uniref:ABC transporter ATP-binding protein n=1 Tax=Aerophobetes bacterium TaxID=2030807 RepID=A0A497E3K4_UNCAE|nr:MAG: ABC transporter ATP-binding protein [Candidatus Aerophobetes bacterium]
MKWVVETTDLSKFYDGIKAVERLNLRIKEGEIYGLLGPNGAGKTTTILMLLGLTEPTSGKALVYGYNSTTEPLKVKRVTGYLPENVGFYEDLTARETLRYIARLNGIPDKRSSSRIDELLKVVGLHEVADWEVGKFSRGMRQRLGIAAVLVKDPKFVILDEPTSGIDPEGARHILELIRKMSREQNITVLLSSHLLYQVQRICDRVGIVSEGHLVAEGSVDQLGRETAGESRAILEVQVEDLKPELLDSIRRIEGVREVSSSADILSIKCDRDLRREISKVIVDSGTLPLQIRSRDYTLEEIYIRYFQRG